MSLFKMNKNRNKVENPYFSLGLLQQTTMINSADHHDLSVVCQAQAYQIVGQQKKVDLCSLCEGGGGVRGPTHRTPPLPMGLLNLLQPVVFVLKVHMHQLFKFTFISYEVFMHVTSWLAWREFSCNRYLG